MKCEVLRRTFKAKEFPKGSDERNKFNEDVVTSEYMVSYKYVLREPAVMSDRTPNLRQKFWDRTFRTKAEAELAQKIKLDLALCKANAALAQKSK